MLNDEGRKEANYLIKLQSIILSLRRENLDISVQMVLESTYLHSNDRKKQFVHNLIVILTCRPFMVDIIAEFVRLILIQNDDPELRKILLRSISLPSHSHQPHLNFFRFYIDKGMFDPQDVVNELIYFSEIYPAHFFNHCVLYAWFAPEIEQISPSHKEKIFEMVSNNEFPSFIKDFFDDYEEIRSNDFSKWKELLTNHGNEIKKAIETDDIDLFVQLISYSPTIVNEYLIPSVFDYASILQNFPLPIHYAAYCASFKIFKFLILSTPRLSVMDKMAISLPSYSIAGGNFSIIRLLEESEESFEGSLLSAAEFFRYEIFEWLFRKYPDTDYSTQMSSHIHKCAASGNIRSLLFCLDNSISANFHLSIGWTPLHLAARSGQSDVVRILRHYEGIDINVQDQKGWTPLHWAVHDCHPNTVRLLLQHPRVMINIKNDDGVLVSFFRLLFIGLLKMDILTSYL